MKRLSRLFMVVASARVGSCRLQQQHPHRLRPEPRSSAAPSPVQDADKQWTMPNKNTSATRYSALSEINTENVKNLKVAWTFSTGVLRGHEGEPLVVGNTMYVHTPFPEHRLRARPDARKARRSSGSTRRSRIRR